MPSPSLQELPLSHFTEELRRLNNFTKNELKVWLFEPGMKFAETDQWWKQGTTREKPHEGLDLLIFLDKRGERHLLLPGTAIPPLLRGTEVARIPDFMGETVILAHDIPDDAGRRLHTFYAHLQPTGGTSSRATVMTTNQIGKIVTPGKTTLVCPAHLHLSLAWIDKSYPIQDFHWEEFRESETFRPDDPLALLGCEL